jgi:hypothetical protein
MLAESEPVDAILIASHGPEAARYADALSREGYRVHILDSVEAALHVASECEAVVAFVPSSTGGHDLARLRTQLRSITQSGVAVVVLGQGWAERMPDAPARIKVRPPSSTLGFRRAIAR